MSTIPGSFPQMYSNSHQTMSESLLVSQSNPRYVSDSPELPPHILPQFPSDGMVPNQKHVYDEQAVSCTFQYPAKTSNTWNPTNTVNLPPQMSHRSHPQTPQTGFIESLDHDTLLRNKLYRDLYHAFVSAQSKLESSREAFQLLMASLRSGYGQTESGSAPALDGALAPSPSLLVPLLQRDYPAVKFWQKRTWVKSKQQDVTELSNVVGLRGKARIAAGENVAFGFVEDENGEAVNGFRISQITGVMREVWLELHSKDLAPPTWGQGTASIRNCFRTEMYKRFPELKLCENHWKVDHIATTNYSGWHRKFVLGNIKSIKKEDGLGDDKKSSDNANDYMQLPQKRTLDLSSHPPSKKFKVPKAEHVRAQATPAPNNLSIAATLNSGLAPDASSNAPSIAATPNSVLAPDTSSDTATLNSVLVPNASSNAPSITATLNSALAPDASSNAATSNSVLVPDTSSNATPPASPVLKFASLSPVLSNSGLDSLLGSKPAAILPESNPLEPELRNTDHEATTSTNISSIIIDPLEVASEVVETPLSNTAAASQNTQTVLKEKAKRKEKGTGKKEPMMVPSKALTPKNLFAIEYCRTNTITRRAFEDLWARLDPTTRQRYEDLSKSAKQGVKEAKAKAALAAVNGGG